MLLPLSNLFSLDLIIGVSELMPAALRPLSCYQQNATLALCLREISLKSAKAEEKKLREYFKFPSGRLQCSFLLWRLYFLSRFHNRDCHVDQDDADVAN